MQAIKRELYRIFRPESYKQKIEVEIKETYESYLEILILNKEDLKYKKILDIGCGSGSFIRYIRTKLGNLNAFGIEENKGRVALKDFGGEGLSEADATKKLNFENESFNLVTVRHFMPMFLNESDNRFKLSDLLVDYLRILAVDGEIIFDLPTMNGMLKSEKDIESWRKESPNKDKKQDLELAEKTKIIEKNRREGLDNFMKFLSTLDSQFQVSTTITHDGITQIIKIKKLK
jgi:SAM-dependent methyltransferase